MNAETVKDFLEMLKKEQINKMKALPDDNPVKKDYFTKKKCCICGKTFIGFGNNPYPVKSNGQCCDKCNYSIVIVARCLSIGKDGILSNEA